MDCRETRLQLNALLDGELSAAHTGEVQAHLAECAACRAECAALRELGRGIAALPRQQPPPQFLPEVRARLERPERLNWSDRLFRPFWLKLPLEALAVVVVGMVVLTLYWSPRREARMAPEPSAAPATPADDLDLPHAEAKRGALKAQIAMEEVADKLEENRQRTGKDAESLALPAAPAAPSRTSPAGAAGRKDDNGVITAPRTNVLRREAVSVSAVPSPAVSGRVIAGDERATAETAGLVPQLQVHATEFRRGDQRVQTAVTQVGGRVLEREEATRRLRVEVPAAQLPALRALLASSAEFGQDRDQEKSKLAARATEAPLGVMLDRAAGAGEREGGVFVDAATSNVVVDVQIVVTTEP